MDLGNERNPEGSVNQTESCCHYWIIQSALGPVSEGSCRNCGEVRVFKNSIDYEDEWTNRRDVARSKAAEAPDAPGEAKKISG